MSVIKSIETGGEETLLLDCGGSFPNGRYGYGGWRDRLTSELGLKVMNRMGYDAVNLGKNELI